MNKIEKLIQQLCPEGVEYKQLKEVCSFRNGFAFKSGKFKKVGEPILRIGNIQNRKVDFSNLIYFDKNEYSENLKPFEVSFGDILIAMSGATTGKIGIIKTENIYYLNQRVGKFEPNIDVLNNSFLYHFLLTKSNQIYAMAGGGAQPNLSSIMVMDKISIPIPPLPIQQEIVTILDKFTQLEAELEAELEARSRQYEYYRNQLLSFNEDVVKLKSLNEVCLKTSNIKWKDNIGNEYKYIDLSAVNRENNKIEELQIITSKNAPSRAQQIVKTDDIIFGTTRPTLKRYAVITDDLDGQICSTGFCVLRPNQEIVSPRFLFYILKSSSFFNYVENNQEGAGYPSISNSKVKNFKYPIPSLEEQERIVKILDQFDALVNDIKTGLPAEIQARRKQYEYYRNKLLTFQKT